MNRFSDRRVGNPLMMSFPRS